MSSDAQPIASHQNTMTILESKVEAQTSADSQAYQEVYQEVPDDSGDVIGGQVEEDKNDGRPDDQSPAELTFGVNTSSAHGVLTMTMMEDYMDKQIDQYCTFEVN